MGSYQTTFHFFDTCEFTGLEKMFIFGLDPIVTEVIKNFQLNHCIEDHEITRDQILVYKRKIDFIMDLMEPCDRFLKNYPLWAKQRKETIESLRKVETYLKNLVEKYHPILKVLGPRAHFMFSDFLMNLLKPSGILTETEKKALLDLKSEIEENRNKTLKMCALDLNLLHELGTREFYDRIVDSVNDLFGSHEILDDLLKLLENLPEEEIANAETQLRTCLECTQLQICLESILPKITKLLSDGLPITCTILKIFFAVFMSRRQSCAILSHRQDLGILNSAETEVTKLIASSCVKGSKLEKMISLEIKKKIVFGEVNDVAINLDVATLVLNSFDVDDGFLIPETRLIVEIANKLEKEFNSYQKVFELLEKSSNERLKMYDINNWSTIIIYHIPTVIEQTGIKNAIKPLLRKKAQECIELKRLPTNGHNWLVKIPTYYSHALLKEKYIVIAKERCLVMA